ncbi:unnamed protein product [Gongylonema pulchrum]|uniref:Serpin domain-containing protein n=1 Tax=Gongylonema pulchrum TaxID=637853 RepID=A0A3P6RAX5_9BILA|nr:unnamed protein product [Gongylonema pulchrum]
MAYTSNLQQTNTAGEKQKYALEIANRIFLQRQFPVKRTFVRLIQSNHRGQLQGIDFRQKAAAIRTVNGWVSNQTHGKIKDLISASNINSNTVLMLLNAIYFKGTWKKQFNSSDTKEKPFYVTANQSIQVKMMSTKNSVLSYSDDKLRMVGLPYEGGNVHMFLVLPRKRFSLAAVEKSLTGKKLLENFAHSKELELRVFAKQSFS